MKIFRILAAVLVITLAFDNITAFAEAGMYEDKPSEEISQIPESADISDEISVSSDAMEEEGSEIVSEIAEETEAQETEAETESETEQAEEKETEDISNKDIQGENSADIPKEEVPAVVSTPALNTGEGIRPEDPIDAFVVRCYNLILEREPEEQGFNDWTERIRSGQCTGADILYGFLFSKEYKDKGLPDETFITILYNVILDREPDEEGFETWTTMFRYNFTERFILKGFTDSREFKDLCEKHNMLPGTVELTDIIDKNYNVSLYAAKLYNNILKRDPDINGQKGKVNSLIANGARPVILSFFQSGEYIKQNTTDTQYITDIYRSCLGRNPDSSGLSSRLDLLDKGYSRDYILQTVLNSPEFESKTAKQKVDIGAKMALTNIYNDKRTKLREFVIRSYQNGLNRMPSEGEISSRLYQLDDLETPIVRFLYSIVSSAEFGKKVNTEEAYVKAMYRLLLLRDPGKSEVSSKVKQLRSIGKRELFYYFANSSEFIKKCKGMGLDPSYDYRKAASESFAEANVIKSILTKNPCYVYEGDIAVKGLMLHSVGCSMPRASFFVNAWNSPNYDRACVHGFIDANTGMVYQTLPWSHRGWHAGGSANDTHIGVEMCEPASITYTRGATFTCSDLADAKAAVKRTYDSAVQLFAMLCYEYDLDPLKDGVIISHNEGYYRGVASGHADPEHLWRQLETGYTMDGFRRDVNNYMKKYFK